MFLFKRFALLTATCLAAAGGAGLLAPPARAEFIISIQQSGPNVVVTGSGTINTTDLYHLSSSSQSAIIAPYIGYVAVGPSSGVSDDPYIAVGGTAPVFGTGGYSFPSSGSGDIAGFGPGGAGSSDIFVPLGYVSGAALSDTTTYSSATFASLGLTPGTYTDSWGSGAGADSIVLQVGASSPVPEPSGALLLVLPLAALGFVARSCRTA
jgi:hypothetical protein